MFMRFLILGVFAAFTLALHPAPASADAIVMKIGNPTVGDQQTAWMGFFKKSVDKNSKGRIDVQLYPNSQLGSTQHMIEGVQFGSIQAWVGATEFLSGIDPRFQVLTTPGVFTSPAAAQKTLHDPAVYNLFSNMAVSKGLKGIGLFFGDEDAIVMRKPVTSVADFKNTKIRVLAGAIEMQYMKELGATGIPMPMDQVAPAIEQGAIDGMLEGITTAAPFKQYGVAKYFVDIGQTYYCNSAVVSTTWFNALPADLQKVIVQGGRDADAQVLAWDLNNRTQQFKAWIAGGGVVVKLTPEQRTELNSALGKVPAAVYDGKPELTSAYEIVKASSAKNR